MLFTFSISVLYEKSAPPHFAQIHVDENNENHHLKQREEKVNKWLSSLGF